MISAFFMFTMIGMVIGVGVGPSLEGRKDWFSEMASTMFLD